MCAFHAVDDAAHRVRRLDRERLGITARGHKRQHHHVGIAVEKHVFHEFLGSQAIEVTACSGLGSQPASRFGRPLESVGRHRLYPSAGWVNEVTLHVKDKLTLAADPRLGELRFQRRFRFEFEEAAGLAGCCIGGIEREQRARRAASRNQEIAAAKAQSLRVSARRLLRQAVAGAVGRRKRHRFELPVRGRVQLDRQPPAFRIDRVFHANEYRPRGNEWR